MKWDWTDYFIAAFTLVAVVLLGVALGMLWAQGS